ncbi:MAG TPA: MmgE/PrpD family protein, partial [Burkholderiales bacterium]|nr:MmgE/PrpD family protein [Burkholderiales bacterium]
MNAPSAQSVAEVLVDQALRLRGAAIPAAVRERAEQLLIDIVGLCVAARGTDYIKALVAAADSGGGCTAIGHAATYGAGTAALINGTAAHGEDFDDTFEGGPVHSSAVVIPAVLAACERFGRDGRAALTGIAAGVEATCRLSMIIPKAIHKAGFHPTSVLGTIGAALAAAVAMGLDRRQTVDALGIAGS